MAGVIGLHLGQGWIGAAQIGRGGALAAWAVMDWAEGALSGAGASRLRSILERRGFEGERVVIAAPDEDVFSAVLEVPRRDGGAPIDAIVRAELARLERVEAQGFACASWDLPAHARQREGSSVMAVGCAHEAGERVCALLESGGFEVVAIDARVCAMARAAGPLGDGLAAIMEVGERHARVIVLLGGVIVYERVLSGLGLERARGMLEREMRLERDVAAHVVLHEGLIERFGDERDGWERLGKARETLCAWAGELAHEARVAIGYVRERYGCGEAREVVLMGRGARVGGLGEALAADLGVATRVWRASDVVGSCECDDPALSTAVGLAMREER